MIQHFLLTRFNIKIDRWQTARGGIDVRSESWLEDRFELFKNYCLPSVLQQSNRDFTWCILMDLDTPQEYKGRMRRLLRGHDHIHVGQIRNGHLFGNFFRKFIRKQLHSDTEFVITTRMDNDDIIRHNFIDQIQSKFSSKDDVVIDCANGYQLDIRREESKLYDYNKPFNHFISYVERVKPDHIETVICRQHRMWAESKNIITIDQRLWIELIHKNNYANRLIDKLPVTENFGKSAFALDGL